MKKGSTTDATTKPCHQNAFNFTVQGKFRYKSKATNACTALNVLSVMLFVDNSKHWFTV